VYHYRQSVKLSAGKQLLVIPLGDVQGDEQLDRLDRLIAWSVKHKKKGNHVLFVLTGDYFETYSPSERVKKAGANFHETTLETIHSHIKAQADDFIRRLKPMEGSIAIVLQGHHWENVKINGHILSSDQYIAERLNSEYAGDGIGVLDLLINGLRFRVMAMHGYGNGREAGGRVNKRLKMREVIANCNMYFMGHDNEKFAIPKEPLIVEAGQIRMLKQYFVGIGCHQESYHIGKLEAGYAERAAYPPAVIGSPIGFVKIKNDSGRPELDYHVSV